MKNLKDLYIRNENHNTLKCGRSDRALGEIEEKDALNRIKLGLHFMVRRKGGTYPKGKGHLFKKCTK